MSGRCACLLMMLPLLLAAWAPFVEMNGSRPSDPEAAGGGPPVRRKVEEGHDHFPIHHAHRLHGRAGAGKGGRSDLVAQVI